MDFMLNAQDDLTNDIVESGAVTFHDLFRCVKNYKYARINMNSLNDVWYKRQGTCSSKHAFLKHVANLNDLDVKLFVLVFKMNAKNTKSIQSILEENNLKYIPEAHCVLSMENEFLDATSNQSSYDTIIDDILTQREVDIDFIVNGKILYHKDFLKNWIDSNPNYTDKNFEEVWSIREKCIAKLSED